MKNIDRFSIGILAAGVWTLVALQLVSVNQSSAQETPIVEQVEENRESQEEITLIHATDIVGLSALLQQAVRDHQPRPQSMPGLEQYVKSIVRNCRINGSVSGGRLSATSISC